MIHIIYYAYFSDIKRNAFESDKVRWMNLEPLMQSEVSQKEKNKYCILTHIYMESRKMALMNLGENRLVDTAWEGEGVMNRERSIHIYTLHYHG